MLPRSQRLSVGQFDFVMMKGKITNSPLFVIRSVISSGQPKIAAVVPVKICKTAVGRNRLRRKIYEMIGPVYPNIKDGVHAIIFAKNTCLKEEFDVLKGEVSKIFVKAGLLK